MNMDLPQDQHSGSATDPITIEVPGSRSIHIPDSTLVDMEASCLKYHRGSVSSGSQIDGINACSAIVFKYKDLKEASEKYAMLAAFDHRCVLEPLGYGQGLIENKSYSLLALRPFEKTFHSYTVNNAAIDQRGRLKLNFIKLVSDIIDGIEELHMLGYCCTKLKGDDIAVIEQADLVTAKLWHFGKSVSGSEQINEAADWLRLGYLIWRAANCSDEAQDLLDRIKSGQLKGKSILRHSCLLTVREKFNNLLALHFHISSHYPSVLSQSENLDISKLCGANLQNDLDKRLSWNMPAFVTSLSITNPPKTLRGFMKMLRDVLEHEDRFIPEEMNRELTVYEIQLGKTPKDLERHLHKSCSKLLLAAQMVVADLNLQY